MAVGLERYRLCLGEKGGRTQPAAGKGERAIQAEGTLWTKAKIT